MKKYIFMIVMIMLLSCNKEYYPCIKCRFTLFSPSNATIVETDSIYCNNQPLPTEGTFLSFDSILVIKKVTCYIK